MFATSTDKTQIYYEVAGAADAPPLLLSNALGASISMWDPQLPILSRHFHVIRYDARGHGSSEAPDGPYSIKALGEDALTVLRAAGVEGGVRFMGLSAGGIVGMWLGLNAPEVFERLVFANTAAYLPTREFWAHRAKLVRKGGMGAVVDSIISRWFTEDFRTTEPAVVDEVRRMLFATSSEAYSRCCETFSEMDQRETIAAIRAPTLVIAGSRDPVTTVEQAQELVLRIPGARLQLLSTSHLSNIEASAEFSNIVCNFLIAPKPL